MADLKSEALSLVQGDSDTKNSTKYEKIIKILESFLPFLVTGFGSLACWFAADSFSFGSAGVLSGTCAGILVVVFGVYGLAFGYKRGFSSSWAVLLLLVFELLMICNGFSYRWKYLDLKTEYYSGDTTLSDVPFNLNASQAADYSIFLFKDTVYVDDSQGECDTVTSYNNQATSYYCVSPVLDTVNKDEDNILFWAIEEETATKSLPSCTGSCAGVKRNDGYESLYYEAIVQIENNYAVTAVAEDDIVYLVVSSSIASIMSEYLKYFIVALLIGLAVPFLVCVCLNWDSLRVTLHGLFATSSDGK
mmetsp:Transcript_3684/g.4760  ORF Transcript_3684/g.4760 Transcript_3684/m.4760 type:complete len:305 (-) Transcript_3684:154-1068(-)|eukprot:CAMPEP_0117858050 /NCGR_PEP_ID=MMETSP0950-20121206/2263_1 /TAXON_ID=44440 /ORGANISM="Chattonella subsalsa, Strain CCMP2191" /LENGTH=304 /DNA_ID=CAMNT_0005707571 /DNA_START=8 /DNA_END=922 /DNA_ORIENTATION=+